MCHVKLIKSEIIQFFYSEKFINYFTLNVWAYPDWIFANFDTIFTNQTPAFLRNCLSFRKFCKTKTPVWIIYFTKFWNFYLDSCHIKLVNVYFYYQVIFDTEFPFLNCRIIFPSILSLKCIFIHLFNFRCNFL